MCFCGVAGCEVAERVHFLTLSHCLTVGPCHSPHLSNRFFSLFLWLFWNAASYSDPKSWRLLADGHSRFDDYLKDAPCLIMERPFNLSECRSTDASLISSLSKERLAHMEVVYVIEPSPTQAYACKQLHNVPHYQMFTDLVEVQLVPLCQSVGGRGDAPPIRVVRVSKEENFSDDFLHVRNDLSDTLFQPIDFAGLIERLNSAETESSRGHRRIDLGATGNRNSRRNDPASLGLAKPQSHLGTREMFGQQMLFLREILRPCR